MYLCTCKRKKNKNSISLHLSLNVYRNRAVTIHDGKHRQIINKIKYSDDNFKQDFTSGNKVCK